MLLSHTLSTTLSVSLHNPLRSLVATDPLTRSSMIRRAWIANPAFWISITWFWESSQKTEKSYAKGGCRRPQHCQQPEQPEANLTRSSSQIAACIALNFHLPIGFLINANQTSRLIHSSTAQEIQTPQASINSSPPSLLPSVLITAMPSGVKR